MALEEFTFKQEIRVLFRDIDYYRHVNNVAYVAWMETARIDYCRAAFDRPLTAKPNVILAAQSFSYERQAEYDDRLIMGCRCARLGKTSLQLVYELWRAGERIGSGAATLVAFDYEAGRSIPLPTEWRRRIVAYETIAPVEALSPPGGDGS